MPYKDPNKRKEWLREHYKNHKEEYHARSMERKEYHKQYSKKHYEEHKEEYYLRTIRRRRNVREWLANYKKSLECIECGCRNPVCIDFHHIDDKKDTIANITQKTLSIYKIKEELKKCVPICANCHRKIHKKEVKQKYLEDSNNPSQQRKRELVRWFYEYKKTLRCEQCGESESCCMDFHHEKEKIWVVSQCAGKGWSKKKILEEISKCKILCANCHREFHRKSKSIGDENRLESG
jgi:hypothetical protein